MNNVFFVLGPESSGNHITAWILTQMGCFGDPRITDHYDDIMGDEQRLDEFMYGSVDDINEIVEPNKPLVYFQSIPHGNRWPDVIEMRSLFRNAGYEMKSIVVVRDWLANVISNQYRRTKNREASEFVEMLEEAWIWIGANLRHLKPFCFFNASLLFKDPESAMIGLEWFTGLKWPHDNFEIIHDVDRKHHVLFKERGFVDFSKREEREELQRLAKLE